MTRKINRRQFLRSGMVLGAGVALSRSGLSRLRAQDATPEAAAGETSIGLPLTGALRSVHDPVIIKGDDAYYVFCSGNGVPWRRSENLIDWEINFPPKVFGGTPKWALEVVPNALNVWAPDISYFNGKYHLYYSVSTTGSQRSVIGLATNGSLVFRGENYRWEDQGLVIESTPANNYNCIDPNVVVDADGVPWLVFGSYWSGIKMRRLDAETGKLSSEDETLYALATRTENNGSVEAPFMILKDGTYYLFVSFDQCCQGANSTYRVMVGRSESVTGPFIDRDGVPMLEGGGTQVTFPTDRWRGPGHNGILQEDGEEYIIYHAYDTARGQDTPTMHIDKLVWDADGWPLPVIPTPEEDTDEE